MTKSTVELEPVHTKPEEAAHMPYAPAVRIVGACDLMFISGATPSPLYHRHPHVEAEHVHPHDLGEQTRRAVLRKDSPDPHSQRSHGFGVRHSSRDDENPAVEARLAGAFDR